MKKAEAVTRVLGTNYFDNVLGEEMLGYLKHEPSYYEEALKKLSWKAENTVSIGDTIVTDIYPAKVVGIKTIWVNRRNEKRPTEPERTPDCETSNLTSALDFLHRHTSFGWTYKMPEVCCAIAISQVERFDEFVDLRCEIAKLYDEAVEDCAFIIPQFVPKDCKNVYWTYAVKFQQSKKDWRSFRKMYMEKGGDGIYACWSVPYLEPVYAQGIVNRRFPMRMPIYHKGLCPTAEKIQPKIMQFPTNYGSIEEAMPKVEALRKTIREFRK